MVVAALLAAGAARGAPLRILFVGNSLTYYNDAPRMVEGLIAAAQPGEEVHVDMLASGGASMAGHLRQGQLAKWLKTRAFDVVVLQDFGGFPDCGRSFSDCKQAVASVCEAAQRVRGAHAKPILFGTWQTLPARQRALSAATQSEASKCDVELADVGAAMQRFIAHDPDTSPWLNDGHPTLAGSWIVAATLSRTILQHDLPIGMVVPNFCRKRWQGRAFEQPHIGMAPRQPEEDCERLPDHALRAVLQAVNP